MMETMTNAPHGAAFCEEEWMRLLFLLSDTAAWLDDLGRRLFHQVPVAGRKRLFRRSYCLTAPALTHILERHYYKIARHPGAGKFTIPVADILHQLRQAGELPPEPVPGSLNDKRVWEADSQVGVDKEGLPTAIITILTDSGGRIVTAFPGLME
ncbi:MAG: hypothetical protein ABW019_11505 [Chitinophagaceae bacterium]